MIPAGVLYKRVAAPPEWLEWLEAPVSDIYSVSNCIAKVFADYIPFWRHNGFWLFDSPAIIRDVAEENDIDLAGLTLLSFEVLERQYEAASGRWLPFAPDPSFTTDVQPPSAKDLQGFDVVTFTEQTSPECSPLSCNHLANEIPVNRHCLLGSLEEAKNALERGLFRHGEPGPFRIFSVHTVSE